MTAVAHLTSCIATPCIYSTHRYGGVRTGSRQTEINEGDEGGQRSPGVSEALPTQARRPPRSPAFRPGPPVRGPGA
jgi:hypothetical protein